MDPNSPEDGCGDTGANLPDGPNATAPLLLNPAYARAKSSIFDELRSFRICLKWCALDHSSCLGKAVSYTAFVVLTVIVPIASALSVHSPPSVGPVYFNRLAQLPESALAAVSFLTLSAFFRCHGLRQLLLLDGLHDDSACIRRGYARELDRAFRFLAYILLPSFFVELAHKIIFFSTVSVQVPHMLRGVPCNSIAFAATLLSWVYRTGVFLLVCMLFCLTCELQILRFEGFYKMFEESDTGAIFREHLRIRGQLKVTSHRYRMFVIGCLVTITVSQLGALMLVLASKSEKNFCNSGDLVVCSAVQLSGFLMCLIGAARITHRAQRVVTIASRWHMIMSWSSKGKSDASLPRLMADELDASDHAPDPKSSMLSPSQETSTFESGQALVMYLQHNGGGITLYGFALDRGLLHTLFAFELTLVLWILSKVIVLS